MSDDMLAANVVQNKKRPESFSFSDQPTPDHDYGQNIPRKSGRKKRKVGYEEEGCQAASENGGDGSADEFMPSSDNGNQSARTKNKKFVCDYCPEKFSYRQSLSRHKKKKHRDQQAAGPYFSRMSCSHCKAFRCDSVKNLISHHNDEHGRSFRIQHTDFDSEEAFKKWKSDIERDHDSWFVKPCGDRHFKEHTSSYYQCNRAGFYKAKKERKRVQKSQGTSKIGGHCCAFLHKTVFRDTGKVRVEFCIDHIHETKVAHLKMSEDLRTAIAGKLASGVDSKCILDEVREKLHTLNGRNGLVTHQDILNIKKEFKINATCNKDVNNSSSTGNKDANNSSSPGVWVHELRAQDYDPVLVYKPQGQDGLGLGRDSFLLGLQNEFQRDMLMEFGTAALCIDSTHETTQSQFQVTTLAVVDDFGEAIPVAWLISDKEDENEETLRPFFEAIRQKVGHLRTDVFMSDIDNNFYNAWCKVFPKPKQLYCAWHIKRNWDKNIKSKVKDEDSRKDVKAMLEILLREPDEYRFRNLLNEFLAKMEYMAPDFLTFFYSTYVHNDAYRWWAVCFQRMTLVNVNMFVEPLNRVFKDVNLKRKRNSKVDTLLYNLLKIARDKGHERYINLEKGMKSRRMTETQKGHPKSLDESDVETVVAKEEWAVLSRTDKHIRHTVRKIEDHCRCRLKCNKCDVCVHLFSCSCLDYMVHSVACYHLHTVQMLNQRENDPEGCEDDDVSAAADTDHSDNHGKNVSYFNRVLGKRDMRLESVKLEEEKKDAVAAIDELLKRIQSAKNVDAVRGPMKHVREAIATAHALAGVGF